MSGGCGCGRRARAGPRRPAGARAGLAPFTLRRKSPSTGSPCSGGAARGRRRGRHGAPTRKKFLDPDELRQLGEAQEEDLEREGGDVGPPERPVGLGEERQEPEERLVRRHPRELTEARGAVLGESGRRDGLRIGREAHGAAHERGQVVQRRARVRAGGVELGAALEDPRAVARENGREERDERRAVGRSEHGFHVPHSHAAARPSRGLIEEREPVPQAAGRRGRQRAERGALDERAPLLRGGRGLDDREALARRDVGEAVGDFLVRQAPEVEPLAAREDRRRDLVALGRREDEDGVGRRLLERLQERLERGRRDRVDLVDDENLAAVPRGRVGHDLDEVARLVDLPVRGAVDLERVDRAPFEDLRARGARSAGRRGRPIGVVAVDRRREEPRRRGLADAARAREQVGVRETVGRDRVREGPDDLLLADDVRERARAPLAGEGNPGRRVAHGSTVLENNCPESGARAPR